MTPAPESIEPLRYFARRIGQGQVRLVDVEALLERQTDKLSAAEIAARIQFLRRLVKASEEPKLEGKEPAR
jgi:hypothetical protein